MPPVLKATNPNHFNKTLLFSGQYQQVYIGNFTIKDNVTAHMRMKNKLTADFRDIFGNVAQIHGGSIKSDGTIEMNSGTFNGIMFADMRSRPDLIPLVAEAIAAGRCSIVDDA